MQESVQASRSRLDSASLFHADRVHPFSVLEFWSWALSDLQDNANRGVLAEFIVAKAIGAEIAVRGSWDDFDLVAPGGVSFKVKASAFLQTWNQCPKTPPSFANLKVKTEPFFRGSIYICTSNRQVASAVRSAGSCSVAILGRLLESTACSESELHAPYHCLRSVW